MRFDCLRNFQWIENGKSMLFSLICSLFLRKDKYCCYAFELALISADFIVKQTGLILIVV